MMRRGSRVPVLEALLLALEFMASKRSRTAGYVLELPNGDKQVSMPEIAFWMCKSGGSRAQAEILQNTKFAPLDNTSYIISVR